MFVVKRNLDKEEVSFDKVLRRIKTISDGLHVSVHEIAQKVCSRIYDGVKTSELDELAAQICSAMMLEHPDYGTLASRIIISNHQKNTSPSFSEAIQILYNNVDSFGNPNPLISEDLYNTVQKYKEKLNSYIDYNRDFNFDYFGFKTLERAYLLKVNGRVVERPQHMFMRVSLGMHGNDIKDALQTYDMMSQKYFVHATPTLFNSGTRIPQLSSCFLEAMEADSIEGIYNTLKDCALISKYAGGIGLHIHNIRGRNAVIRGTNGTSTGIVPMLRVFNNTARYVNQCFTPDTIVFTDKGPKEIRTIQPYDSVLTRDSTFKRVNQVARNPVDKQILEISVEHGFKPVRCTKEHQVYALKTCKGSIKNVIQSIKTSCVNPAFYDARELDVGDMLGFPIPTLIADAREVTTDFARFYGLMLASGDIDHVTSHASLFVPEHTSINTLHFVKAYLSQNNINYEIVEQHGKGYTFKWITEELGDTSGISSSNMYDMCNNKTIYHAWSHLPQTKTITMLQGMLETMPLTNGKVYFTTSSQKLATALRYQLIRLGILPKGYTTTCTHADKSTPDQHDIKYVIDIPRHAIMKKILYDVSPLITMDDYSGDNDFIVWGNVLWTRISSIVPVQYTGMVYDLNVQDNHNYTTDMGLVHNSGKRNGSIAIYLEPWHADVETFIEMRKNHGNEEERARDLFYALWIPDLFMKRVKEGGVWSLMCPDICQGLADVYGDAFEELYTKYESEGKFVKQMPAQDLWFRILEAQIETGTPYMLYKDHVNKKNNQANLGIIKSSNLCVEICEYSSPEETAVCNLASICLPSFVNKTEKEYDFEKLHSAVKIVVKNLNKVIDVNYYPIEKARLSNMRHRPIGIGVQGLADTFALLKLPFESQQARELNQRIFETMYHAAVEASMELAKKYGPYETFKGSPASEGKLQFDLWGVKPMSYDWDALKNDVVSHGMRNSLLIAPMPTASTSQIMGFNEAFEPFTSNIYKRKTLAGEFILVNKYLINDLSEMGLWNHDMKNQIIINDGSIQNISNIPAHIKELYKTVWEIKMRTVIDMAADRGAFVDQSQSMNLFVESPDFKKLSSMHFYAWSKGLKTGMYYLRTKAKAKAQQFTIDPKLSRMTNLRQETSSAASESDTCDNSVCEACSA